MRIRLLMFATVATVATGAMVALAAEGLDVKLGLWQMTVTTDARGTFMPKEGTANLTPEQRAKLAAALQKQAAMGPQTITEKSCVTAKDLKDGAFRPEEDKSNRNCKWVIKAQTRTLQEGTLTCTGAEPRSSTMRVEAVGRDRIKGSFNGTAQNSKFSMQITGKWLSASCAGADDE